MNWSIHKQVLKSFGFTVALFAIAIAVLFLVVFLMVEVSMWFLSVFVVMYLGFSYYCVYNGIKEGQEN